EDIPELFSSTTSVAVYRNKTGEIKPNGIKFLEINGSEIFKIPQCFLCRTSDDFNYGFCWDRPEPLLYRGFASKSIQCLACHVARCLSGCLLCYPNGQQAHTK